MYFLTYLFGFYDCNFTRSEDYVYDNEPIAKEKSLLERIDVNADTPVDETEWVIVPHPFPLIQDIEGTLFIGLIMDD